MNMRIGKFGAICLSAGIALFLFAYLARNAQPSMLPDILVNMACSFIAAFVFSVFSGEDPIELINQIKETAKKAEQIVTKLDAGFKITSPEEVEGFSKSHRLDGYIGGTGRYFSLVGLPRNDQDQRHKTGSRITVHLSHSGSSDEMEAVRQTTYGLAWYAACNGVTVELHKRTGEACLRLDVGADDDDVQWVLMTPDGDQNGVGIKAKSKSSFASQLLHQFREREWEKKQEIKFDAEQKNWLKFELSNRERGKPQIHELVAVAWLLNEGSFTKRAIVEWASDCRKIVSDYNVPGEWNDQYITFMHMTAELASNRAESQPGECHPSGAYTKFLITADVIGSGFETRLHQWVKDKASDIHNHPWPYASKVLSGSVEVTFYRESDSGDSYTRTERFSSGLGEHARDGEKLSCYLKPTGTVTFTQGEVYVQPHWVIHQVKALDDGTKTLVLRGPDVVNDRKSAIYRREKPKA